MRQYFKPQTVLMVLAAAGALTLVSTGAEARPLKCETARTQGELNDCAAQELALQTQIINTNYNLYRQRLAPQQKESFRQVQLAWIKFKDTSCAYEASGVAGGSAYGMILSNCLSEMTRKRNLEILSLLNCKEGDLSCPG